MRDPVRRALTIATVAVVVVWVVVLLVWDEAPFALTFDDAYYYFAIARNVADGAGSTFDGINATNGYHPLWLGIAVVPYAVGLDDLAAARALLVAQVVAWGVALWFVGDIVARLVDGWSMLRRRRRTGDDDGAPDPGRVRAATTLVAVVFALAVGNPYIVKVFANGLESGVVVVLHAALLALVVRRSGVVLSGSPGWRWGLGALVALSFLARTDAVLLVAALGVWTLAEAWSLPRRGMRELVELWTLPASVLVGYLAVNAAVFDSATQISGVVKRAPLTAGSVVGGLVVVGVAGLVGHRAFRRTHGQPRTGAARFPLVDAFAVATGWYAAFCVLVVGYYVLFQVQQWLWYFAPVVLWVLVVFALTAADFCVLALRAAPRTQSPARALAVPAVLLVGLLVVAGALQTRAFADPDIRSIQIANRDAGEWIDANLPDDAVLASWDAGVVGYFSHRSVVNLDGVVNSTAFARAGEEGTIGPFLACEGLGYLVNHGADVDGEDPDIRPWLERRFDAEASADAEVVHTLPFTYAGTTTGASGRQGRGEGRWAVHVYELGDLSRFATSCP